VLKKYLAMIALSPLMIGTVLAQDAETGSAPTTVPAKSAYLSMRPEDLPRDANGLLTTDVWDIIKKEATAKPVSNESMALRERPLYQAYYATYAGWTAPPPLPVSEGRLRNLADTPTKPRFEITDLVWPTKPGEASVCLWEDDKLAAMSLGVDDNCAFDLPYWKELSKKYGGLNITWNLITGNVDGAITLGRIGMSGKWDTWQQMLNEGFHIASHSVTHNHDPVPADGWPGPEWEAAESIHQIDSHLPGHRTRIYAYPGSGVHAFGVPRGLIKTAYRPALVKYFVGARGAGAEALNAANMIDYFDIHSSTGSVPYLLDPNPPSQLVKSQNLNHLFAADPKDPYHKYYRGWATIFIHFINNGKTFDTDPYTIAYAKVLQFYSDNRDKLWTGFIDDVALYGQERDMASIRTDEASDAKIVFTLTSKMEPTIFDYPLTVKVRLPDGWANGVAQVKDQSLPVKVINHDGANYALVKVAPDRGPVTLTAGK